MIFDFKLHGFRTHVIFYLHGVKPSIRGADAIDGEVAGDGVGGQGVPAVDVHLAPRHGLRQVAARSPEEEEEGVGQREGLQLQRQLHGATHVVHGGRGGGRRAGQARAAWWT